MSPYPSSLSTFRAGTMSILSTWLSPGAVRQASFAPLAAFGSRRHPFSCPIISLLLPISLWSETRVMPIVAATLIDLVGTDGPCARPPAWRDLLALPYGVTCLPSRRGARRCAQSGRAWARQRAHGRARLQERGSVRWSVGRGPCARPPAWRDLLALSYAYLLPSRRAHGGAPGPDAHGPGKERTAVRGYQGGEWFGVYFSKNSTSSGLTTSGRS